MPVGEIPEGCSLHSGALILSKVFQSVFTGSLSCSNFNILFFIACMGAIQRNIYFSEVKVFHSSGDLMELSFLFQLNINLTMV